MSPLKAKILALIHAEGPISIARYMEMALSDPEYGYYMRRDPLGVAGDFITAPEVSQIFGELIGLFFVQAWEDRGRPAPFHFVELGPGRGTLMADMLRAAKLRPAFGKAAQITLVETSPALRAAQAKTLGLAAVTWAKNLDEVPKDAPLFLVANEFFDALPVHQFVMKDGGWHERVVAAEGDNLIFALSPEPMIPPPATRAEDGAIFETCPAGQALVVDIARRVATDIGGVALMIDYGHAEPGFGDTFQAVKRHVYAAPLAEPGEADLTAHVDFAALVQAASAAEARAFGPEPQGAFLEALGVHARATQLKLAAPEHAPDIESAVDRLIDPKGMGALFKVLAISDGHFRALPGFPC